MAVTKLYLTANAATFAPTNFRGSWDDTAGAVTKLIDSVKDVGGNITNVFRAEAVTTNPYRVCLYRGVSGPLAAQTISDTLNVLIGVTESNTTADFNWHVHAYITTGDTDTVRGTLITDYEESAGTNEWGASASTAGKALNAGQTTASVAVTAGDRLVIEIGYTSRNTSATSFTGTLYYGTTVNNDIVADLAASGNATLGAGYISFATGITEAGTIKGRLSQEVLEVLRTGLPKGRTSQVLLEVIHPYVTTGRVTQTPVEVLRANDTPCRMKLFRLPDGHVGWQDFDNSQAIIFELQQTLSTVGQQASLPWTARAVAGQSAGAVWNDRTTIGQARADLWNVRRVVGANRALLWAVSQTVGANSSDRWNVRGTALLAESALWNVRRITGLSGAALWEVTAGVGLSRDALWALRASVGQESILRWSLGQFASIELSVPWQTRGLVALSDVLPWSVHGLAGLSDVLSWRVLVPIGQESILPWSVRTPVAGQAGLLWGVAGHAGLSVLLDWDVLLPVGLSFDADWAVLEQVPPIKIVELLSGVVRLSELRAGRAGRRRGPSV